MAFSAETQPSGTWSRRLRELRSTFDGARFPSSLSSQSTRAVRTRPHESLPDRWRRPRPGRATQYTQTPVNGACCG